MDWSHVDYSTCGILQCFYQLFGLKWMGAVRISVQTADKNIAIIHTTQVHQLRHFLTLRCCFWLKYSSSIHNIAFSSEKVVYCLNQERNMHRLSTVYKQKKVQNCSKPMCRWILMWENNRGWTFFLWGKVMFMDFYQKQKCYEMHIMFCEKEWCARAK